MYASVEAYERQAVESLRKAIAGGTFPCSSLFSGPPFSLRMTSAIETARVLSCGKGGEDDCSCPSCRSFRTLRTGNLLILSHRDDKSIIETSISLFEKLRTRESRLFLLRNTRVALMQYHGALLPAATQKESEAFSLAASGGDILLEIEKEGEEISGKKAKSYASELRSVVKRIQACERRDRSVTIAQIRAIADWLGSTNASGGKRFVIIEGIEDANVGARNSLLKMLEEPPSDSFFILLSSHGTRIMPTILSRVRKFTFAPLTPDQVRLLLSPFNVPEEINSLEDFFLLESGVKIEELASLSSRLARCVMSGTYLSSEAENALFRELDSPLTIEYFIRNLLSSFEEAFLSNEIEEARAVKIARLITTLKSSADLYNQNGKLLVQTMYYRLMEV